MFRLGWACFLLGAAAIVVSIARENVIVPVFGAGVGLVIVAIGLVIRDADVLADHPQERDYGPLGTPHPGYERGPDGHIRLAERDGPGHSDHSEPAWPRLRDGAEGVPPKPAVRVERDREA